MRDMAENMVVLDCIRAQSSSGELNARANGVLNTAGYIDLEDYNYPRRMLICSSVGTVGSTGATLDLDIEHGDSTGALTDDTGTEITQITSTGNAVTEYTPSKRYINIEGIVADAAIVYSVTLIMDHSRYGAQSGLVT